MANLITNNLLRRWLIGKSPPADGQIATVTGSPPSGPPRRIVDTRGDDCCGISDVGKVRDGNEDMFLLAPEHGLFVVADGLGGHTAGEVASELIVRTVLPAIVDRLSHPARRPRDILAEAFQAADDAVHDHAHAHPECLGMGATVIIALIVGDHAVIAHAGDTRAYLSRDGVLQRLTNDHTSVGRLLRDGLLSEDDARRHPIRNVVTRAVMGERNVHPDFTEITLVDGDRLMLCSDGMWDEVSHNDIESILRETLSVPETTTRLVDRALAAGGHDNITAVVYRHRTMDASPGLHAENGQSGA